MHNKRQCLIGIFLKSQKGGQISRKRGQKGGLGGQPPPPPPKRGQFGSYDYETIARTLYEKYQLGETEDNEVTAVNSV